MVELWKTCQSIWSCLMQNWSFCANKTPSWPLINLLLSIYLIAYRKWLLVVWWCYYCKFLQSWSQISHFKLREHINFMMACHCNWIVHFLAITVTLWIIQFKGEHSHIQYIPLSQREKSPVNVYMSKRDALR